MFSTMTFCDWTAPSTRKNVLEETKKHHCTNNDSLRSESKKVFFFEKKALFSRKFKIQHSEHYTRACLRKIIIYNDFKSTERLR